MAKRVLVLTLIALLAFSLIAFGAKAPKDYKMLQRLERLENGVYPNENVVSRYLTTPEPKLIPPVGPLCVAGYTYYDYQDNDGARRRIANDFTGNLHFTWMDLVGNDMTNNRYIDYNAIYDQNSCSDLVPGGMHVTSAISRGGYGGIDILPEDKGGREVLCYHLTQPDPGLWGTTISIEKVTAGLGQFNQFDIPDSVSGSGLKGQWPSVACAKSSDGDTAFIHITHAEGATSGSVDKGMGYVRCFEKPSNHDTLVCQSPGWGSPYLIPKSTRLGSSPTYPNKIPFQYDKRRLGTGVIATSPASDKVAIVWYRNYASSQAQNDLYYVESTNNGSDWIGNSATFVPIQLTNYKPGTTVLAYAYDDIAAVYDYTDKLHIMWTTYSTSSANDVTLWHWSAADGVRKAGFATASSTTDPGAWNLLIAKFTLGVEYLLGNAAYNYLYFNYTKFVDGDLAADELTNGDLYYKASSNGGKTWGPEVNMTNSHTPGCAPPACSSEHWSSIAERVDSFQYVGYVLDHDAGGVPQSEGSFTLNEFAFLKHPRGLVPARASKAFSPTQLQTPVVSATKGAATTSKTVRFDNVGTATLFVKLTAPSWISIDIPNFNIPEGDTTGKTVTLTIGGGVPNNTFKVDSIKIESNNNNVGEIYSDIEWIPIYFVKTDSFYYAEWDTCTRGAVTAVSNVGNIGHQLDSTGMAYNGLNYLFDASPVAVTNQMPGSEIMGFSYIHDRVDFLPEGHVKLEDISALKTTITYSAFALLPWRLFPPPNSVWLGWTEWNKWINTEWTYKGKKRGICIFEYWWTWNAVPPWYPSIPVSAPVGGYFGFAGDWDVTANFSGRDMGGIIDSLNLVYLRQDTVNSDKWYGGFQFLNGYVKQGGVKTNYTVPFNMHVGNNATQMYPTRGYQDDSLWKYMSMPGDFIEQDSAQDMNIIVTGMQVNSPDTSTVVFIMGAALVDDSNLVDFVDMANVVKKMKPGDANSDGKVTVSDVVYLVNYLFKGGPEPWLLWSDANADKKVTVSDVVYLVNYLFKGGPPPIWLCTLSQPPWWTPWP